MAPAAGTPGSSSHPSWARQILMGWHTILRTDHFLTSTASTADFDGVVHHPAHRRGPPGNGGQPAGAGDTNQGKFGASVLCFVAPGRLMPWCCSTVHSWAGCSRMPHGSSEPPTTLCCLVTSGRPTTHTSPSAAASVERRRLPLQAGHHGGGEAAAAGAGGRAARCARCACHGRCGR